MSMKMMKMKAINYINIVYLTNHHTVWCVSIILRSHVWIIDLLEFFFCRSKGVWRYYIYTLGYMISGVCPSFPFRRHKIFEMCVSSFSAVKWWGNTCWSGAKYIYSHSPMTLVILSCLKKYLYFRSCFRLN